MGLDNILQGGAVDAGIAYSYSPEILFVFSRKNDCVVLEGEGVFLRFHRSGIYPERREGAVVSHIDRKLLSGMYCDD